MEEQKLLHYPRLDTVLMVENALKREGEYDSMRQLWLALPKKTMYQTFKVIIDYLKESNKIIVKEGKVIWIWNPEVAKRYSNSNLVVR
jgi:hypothetical protein